jgi:hypothetical protein
MAADPVTAVVKVNVMPEERRGRWAAKSGKVVGRGKRPAARRHEPPVKATACVRPHCNSSSRPGDFMSAVNETGGMRCNACLQGRAYQCVNVSLCT